MNKQSKQSLIKLAIVIGVMILSAFLTSSYAYFGPNNGDVSTNSNLSISMPRYYTYEDLLTKFYLCANHGSSDGTSALSGENRYSSGNGERNFEETPETIRAAHDRAGMVTMGPVNTRGVTFFQHYGELFWGPPTPEHWIGTEEIKVSYIKPTGGTYTGINLNFQNMPFNLHLNMDEIGIQFVDTDLITKTYTPPYQQDGGLGSDQLVYKLFDYNAFLNSTVGLRETNGSHEMQYKSFSEIGMDDVLDQLIAHSEKNPVYTTCLGNANSVNRAAHYEHSRKNTEEIVYDYIYAEADASGSNGSEYSPVQIATWNALGQSNDRTGIGGALYNEALEYATFIKKTDGKMEHRFIDVVENKKVVPVEVSNDSDGNIIVGPFAVEYTEWGVDGGRGWAQFAGIYDANVTTNDKPYDAKKAANNEKYGLDSSEYEIIYNSKSRQTDNLVNPQYPHSGEAFFIKIKKAEGRTEFRSIDFKFRYLNVSGSALEITELLYYYKWTLGIKDGSFAIIGKAYAGHKNGRSSGEQQNQLINLVGSRNYQKTETHYGMYPVKLNLTKKVVNESEDNNEKLNGHEFDLGKTYKFKVSIHKNNDDVKSGNNPLYTYELNLKDNQTESITRYFSDRDEVPYFRVEELDTGGADNVSFEVSGTDINSFTNGVYGRFSDKKSISIDCSNKYNVKSALLKLTKTLGEPAIEDEVYKFDVDITKNANNILKDYSSAIHNGIELKVAKGDNKAHIVVDGKDLGTEATFVYYWLGEAPDYKITEQNSEKYIVSFNGVKDDDGIIEGTFENKFGGIVEVNALNEKAKTKIRIKKVSEPELEEGDVKNYYFRIKVGTKYNIYETLTLPAPDTGSKKEVYGKVYDIILDYKDGDHYEIIEYNDEDSMLKDSENGTIREEGILTEADGTDEAKYTKTAVNEQESHHIDLNIKKTFKDDLVPDDDTVFSFTVEDIQAREAGDEKPKYDLKVSREDNWTSDTVGYDWKYGTLAPIIKIQEAQDSPYVINEVRVLDKDGNVVSCDITKSESDNSVTIKNYPKDIANLTFEIENRQKEYSGKLKINKIVKDINPDDQNEYAFEFIIDVINKDGTTNRETVIASNKNAPERTVNWSGSPKDGPRVIIYEKAKEGFELKELLVNGNKGSFKKDDETAAYKVYDGELSVDNIEVLIDVTNEYKKVGTVDIYKLLVDAEGNPVENSNSVFTFNLKQTLNGDVIDERKNVEIPVGEHYPYTATWTGDEAPKFEISEIKIDGYEVKEIDVDGNKVTGNTATGSFIDRKTIKATYTNQEVENRHGKLVIGKRIVSTTGASIPKDYTRTYQFDVLVKKGEEELRNETISIQVSGNNPVQTKTLEFDWKSNEPTPTYVVREKDTNPIAIYKDGEIITTGNEVSGTLKKDSTIKYEYENGIDVKSGQLVLRKQLQDDPDNTTNLDEKFYFDVKINNEQLPVVVLGPKETWESDIYTWVDGEGPEFIITEENPENSSFVKFDVSNNATHVEKSGSTVKGRLTPMENNTNWVEVVCINKTNENKAKVKITKHGSCSEVKNVSEAEMVNKYNGRGFEVDVSVIYDKGRYFVGGTEYSAENYYKTRITLQIGQTVELPEIKWFGEDEGPKVIANEISMPDGWRLLNYSGNNVVLKPNSDNEIVIENEWGNKSLTIPLGGTVWVDDVKDEKNTQNSTVNGYMDNGEVGVSNVGVVVKRYLIDKNDKIIKDTGYAKAYDMDGNSIKVFPIYTDETGRWDVRRIEIPNVTEAEKAQGAVSVKYGVEYIYDGYTFEPTIYLSETQDTHEIPDPIGTLNATALQRANKTYTSSITERNKLLNRSFALDNSASRNAFNDRFALITGDSAIANDNSTSGYAVGTNNSRMELKYEGTQVSYTPAGSNQSYSSLVSELVTTDNVGRALEQYQVTAYTLFANTDPVNKKVSASGLAYPYDYDFNVGLESRTIKGDKYVATDPYIRNINLGLVYREDADIEVTKEVSDNANIPAAKVIVNQRLTELKVSSLAKLSGNNSYLKLVTDTNGNSEQVSYELGLYKSDYYYRAQAYATNTDVYNGLKKFYKDMLLGDDFETLMNLQAYITYKITVRNSSPTTVYDISVGTIMDYADSSLELVKTNVENYIKDDTNGVGSKRVVAEAPFYMIGTDTNKHTVKLGADYTYTDNRNNLTYYGTQMSFDNPVKLSSGSYATIYATYKIKPYSEDYEGRALLNCDADTLRTKLDAINADGVELGNKANIAEVKTYSVYNNKNGKLAGRVDKDSAPNNIDIVSKNVKEYYEDDTNAAPVITVVINHNGQKTVSGTVWEDNEITAESEAGVSLGDGKYTNGEYTVKGMNIELVEKIQIPTGPNSNEYMEYDYTWPENYDVTKNIISTDDSIQSSLKALTGFDSTIASGDNGNYTFQNIPTGAYVVRFHYGDNNGDYDNDLVRLANGTVIKESDVFKFPAGGDNMKSTHAVDDVTNTSNYDLDRLPAVYNGQDFKSAAYNLPLTDEWLSNGAGDTEIVSKAADSQARRLEVINNSRVLVNANTSLLATAENIKANHDELYKQYSMFADTPKIKVDSDTDLDFVNVNFGVVERPESRLVLDKEIEEITLVDNTERELIKVKYKINYENPGVITQNADGSYRLANPAAALSINEEESFGLEYLQSLSKYEDKYGFLDDDQRLPIGAQNFRYIVYDTSMATSLTLKTTYAITALNLGQADRTTEVLQKMSSDDINAVAQILKANKFAGDVRTYNGLAYGTYKVEDDQFKNNTTSIVKLNNRFSDIVGKTYYASTVDNSDKVVNTRVGQIIDYVDTGLTFEQDINTAENSSWYPTTDDYLYHNDVLDKSIFTTVDYNVLLGDAATTERKSKIMDKDNVYFDTTTKHNIILSVRNATVADNASTNVTNPDLLADLVPYSQDNAKSFGVIRLYTQRSIDSEAEDLIFDNIAEIVNYENEVGRRTSKTVAGNADPKGAAKLGAFQGALSEVDSSATEIITFSQPYGISDRTRFIAEITIGLFSALTIVAAGIVIVKKKVL